MRKMVSVIVGLALLSGCQTHGVGTFWQTHSIKGEGIGLVTFSGK